MPLSAVGRAGLGLLDELGHDRGHVEGRRDQVVGEGGVADHAVLELQLLHQREAEPDRRAALDLALSALRVDRAADVLRGRDLHDSHQPELLVHLDDGALGHEREVDVDVALAVLVEAGRSGGGGRCTCA